MKQLGVLSLNKFETGAIFQDGKTYYTSLTDICVSIGLVGFLAVFTLTLVMTVGSKIDSTVIQELYEHVSNSNIYKITSAID